MALIRIAPAQFPVLPAPFRLPHREGLPVILVSGCFLTVLPVLRVLAYIPDGFQCCPDLESVVLALEVLFLDFFLCFLAEIPVFQNGHLL